MTGKEIAIAYLENRHKYLLTCLNEENEELAEFQFFRDTLLDPVKAKEVYDRCVASNVTANAEQEALEAEIVNLWFPAGSEHVRASILRDLRRQGGYSEKPPEFEDWRWTQLEQNEDSLEYCSTTIEEYKNEIYFVDLTLKKLKEN